ncbi:MAG: NAD-dependent DNA ligase LigA [Defluviitaleaceae bacterium]|nr:NAD-dependent DNA ligase LigA [Defluviitaleaceae bacterium]
MTNEMQDLIKKLNEANKSYYEENREIISNFEYDKLYDELLKLEEITGIQLSNSPTKNVGYDVLESLNKVSHNTKLLSLDKTKDISKIKEFLGNQEGVLSLKLDGLTILLTYENGELLQAVTRGNGIVGEDVTHNVKHFKNIPIKIHYKDRLVVRGEAVITYSDFEEINSKLLPEEQYKNPRNLCSGTVRQLDSSIFSKRKVMFFAFSIIEGGVFEGKKLEKKSKALFFLDSLYFDIVNFQIVDNTTLENDIENLKDMVKNLDMPTDGLVLTYDNIEYSKNLGETSKFPKDSMAFKWQDEEKETIILDIEWNTSRTGLINPIAIFSPVDLEGTEVKKASLHNLSIVEDLEIGIGDTVLVYKANMIIPQISKNLTRSGNLEIPKFCNICNGNIEIRNKNGVKTLNCINTSCKAQLIKFLTHYSSRNAMNIDGLSEATITKFFEKGFLTDLSSLYNLEKYKDEIKKIEGFGEKSVVNILNSIEKSKNCYLYQFIYGLGIFNIGLSYAKLLCNHFDNDIEKIKNCKVDDLININGFGKIMADNVVNYFSDKENVKTLDYIYSSLNLISENETNNSLKDFTFVVTGNLEKFINRKQLQDIIEKKGGKLSNSVTSKTTYLINNDKTSSSSKNKTANKLNIEIINEEEFIEKFLK